MRDRGGGAFPMGNLHPRYPLDRQPPALSLLSHLWPIKQTSGRRTPWATRNDEGGHSYVHKQPETEEDIALCMEALEGCPVEAIGEDGDKP